MIHIKDDVGSLVFRDVVLNFRKNVLSGILFTCVWCSWCYGIYQRSSIYICEEGYPVLFDRLTLQIISLSRDASQLAEQQKDPRCPWCRA